MWILTAALVAASLPTMARADGPPLRNGRFDGKVTVIRLTLAQRQVLDRDSERSRRWLADPRGDFGVPLGRIRLTRAQQLKLKREAGSGPARFDFHDSRVELTTCTCSAANLALRFSATEAEIPHEYLMSDKQAEELDGSWE